MVVLALCLLLEGAFRLLLSRNLRYDYVGDLWILKPDQKGFTFPNSKHATINKAGYRGPEIILEKPTMLFLGDSFTFGYAIGDEDTLTSNLREEFERRGLTDINLINGGVPGYGLYQMLEWYHFKFKDTFPEIIVLNIIEGDIFRQPPQDDPNYARKSLVRRIIRSSSLIACLKPRLEILRHLVAGPERMKEKNYLPYLHKDMQRIKAFHDLRKEEDITLVLHAWIIARDQTRFYEHLETFALECGIAMLPNYYDEVFEQYKGDRKRLFAEDHHPSEIQTKRLASAMSKDLTVLWTEKIFLNAPPNEHAP